ncbi:MAG: hypothetical protein OXH71_05630 [Candidatus Dadabacteria bacterium]|nr:hypothetical protein [Candidatus Dadabacteria bacterium]MDE0520155.1 hypothetical protein [Candidatus Dadabacteria bacterium]MDE0663870.1 hypothetical protein [Candidatus Dadabacteria bacterium]
MNKIVPRTCKEILPPDSDRNNGSLPLEEFRSVAAYVLLGNPGSGKTTAFKTECGALGDDACFITARDFLALDPDSHPEWRDRALFIDGLDEIRAGAYNTRTALDKIRSRIDKLGRPRFRISCRGADWLGENDLKHLARVSKDSAATVLLLDPLTDSDVVSILDGHPDIRDAREFIASAWKRGVRGLLANPQNLNLLISSVVKDGGWPENLLETFEKACSQMIREHNEEHREGQQFTTCQLLDAAGYLCAVSLVCGSAGFARGCDSADEYYLDLDRFSYYHDEALGAALSTGLFEAESDNSRFVPVHQCIAEFLGARCLARLIDKGVPPRRILALVTGEYGIVVSQMRGLCAWLAVHCEKIRAELIKRNPVGIFLYGDISALSNEENMALLEALCRERYRPGSAFTVVNVYRTLTTPEMESVFRDVLTSPRRSERHQALTEFVLDVLKQYEFMPDSSEILLEIVRDNTWLPYINKSALDAYISSYQRDSEITGGLKALLADIHDGSISDPDNELLGTLLLKLYPRQLSPSEIWDYLYEPTGRESEGTYWQFWQSAFCDRFLENPEVDELEVEELLDSLWRRISGLRTAFDAWLLNDLPLRLLVCGLQMHGNRIGRGRLYDWLGVGLSENVKHDEYCLEPASQIRAWLEQSPDIQKTVFEEGLRRCPESAEFSYHALNMQGRLYGATPPPDFGLWCLKRALAMQESRPQASRFLLMQAAQAHKYENGNEGLSLEVLRETTRNSENLSDVLRCLFAETGEENRLPWREDGGSHVEKEENEDSRWIDHVYANRDALRANVAHPGLLHEIAEIYFENYYFWKDCYGPENIRKRFPGHGDLARAALAGLRGTTEREDIPCADEIFDLLSKGRTHPVGLPLLAGLAEVERTEPQDSSLWGEDCISRALLFYYLARVRNYEPRWYLRLVRTRPEIVAETQARFAVSGFRSGMEDIRKLRELARNNSHAQVSRIVSLPLLQSFPVQCNLKQIRNMDYLLWAALKYADRDALGELVARKLKLGSLNVALRSRWLAAGLIVSPEIYKDRLENFTQGREARVRHLAAFLALGNPRRFLLNELEIPELELLIRLIGSYFEPALSPEPGVTTPEKQFSGLVYDLIEHLAADEGSGDALRRLQADPILERCHHVLARMSEVHRTTRNDAGYRHPDIERVCRTFSNEAPANVADLAALLVDRLNEIAKRVRTDNTDEWRKYWNEDSHGRPHNPRHENSCRDILLSDLRGFLPKGIDAQPEGQYVNDRRTDILVSSCGDFRVPIEIKKNGSRDLLSSLRNQLIALYTRDPATGGYGIYLVFWFGEKYSSPLPSGMRPCDFQELKKSIESVLSEDESRKISVCVIDVSTDE